MSDITNKRLPNGVLSKHLRFIWKKAKFERSAWIKELCHNTAPQSYATKRRNSSCFRNDICAGNKEYITKNRGGWAG